MSSRFFLKFSLALPFQEGTDSQMDKLTRENRKLRKTLRSKSPHPSRRRKQASDSEEEEEDDSEGGSDDSDESDDTEPMSSEGGASAAASLQVEGEGTHGVPTHGQGDEAQRALPAHDVGPAD